LLFFGILLSSLTFKGFIAHIPIQFKGLRIVSKCLKLISSEILLLMLTNVKTTFMVDRYSVRVEIGIVFILE